MLDAIIGWFEEKKTVSWILAIILAGIIFWVSSIEFGPGGAGGFPWKSIAYHFVVFFTFSFFFYPALSKKGKDAPLFFVLAVILAFLYGVSDEIHQLFVPGRHFSLVDILTNAAGIFVAGIMYGGYKVRTNLLQLEEFSEDNTRYE